jgi:sigma-E factor negative regulatory protein RseB
MSVVSTPGIIGRLLLSCVFIMVLAPQLHADEARTAKQWLERMMEAVQKLNYQGTFVFLHDNQLEIMKIAHAVDGDRVRESLVSLNGTPREVIRDDESVTCVMPETNEVSIDRRSPSSKFLNILPEDLRQLEAHYTFRKAGQTRMTDRPVQVVMIVPNDRLRYGFRFYLDIESGLPLKSDLMNEQAEPVEQTLFTDLQIGVAEISDIHKRESLYTYRLKSHEGENVDLSQATASRWNFTRLPPGFRLSMQHLLHDAGHKTPIEQYVFSDGLGSLSVFVEPQSRAEAFSGVSRLGAVNAWGGQVQGYQVTAVGEVPAVTILGVVQGMQLNPTHD